MERVTDMSEADDLIAGLHVIPGSFWGMRNYGPGTVKRPAVNGLFIHHTVTRWSDDPCADARLVAAEGIRRFGRPSYSWVIHPTGVVLAMQEAHIGAHTANHNSTSFGLSFIGDYSNRPVPVAATRAAAALALTLKRFGLINGAAPVRPHKAVVATACPGGIDPDGVAVIRNVVRNVA